MRDASRMQSTPWIPEEPTHADERHQSTTVQPTAMPFYDENLSIILGADGTPATHMRLIWDHSDPGPKCAASIKPRILSPPTAMCKRQGVRPFAVGALPRQPGKRSRSLITSAFNNSERCPRKVATWEALEPCSRSARRGHSCAAVVAVARDWPRRSDGPTAQDRESPRALVTSSPARGRAAAAVLVRAVYQRTQHPRTRLRLRRAPTR